MKKLNLMNEDFFTSKTVPVIFFIALLALPALGFCDSAEMDAVSLAVQKEALATWIKRIFCTFFAVTGIYYTAATQTIKPFLMFGGISFVIGFIDKLINFFSTLSL